MKTYPPREAAPITRKQFVALAELMRLRSVATEHALSAVLCTGMAPYAAAMHYGISSQSVYRAVNKAKQVMGAAAVLRD